MTALTTLCPRNESRTSTHAISVPKRALTAATASDVTSVSFSAATACGELISLQNELPADRQTSAASGTRTTSERYAVANPPTSAGRRARRPRAAGTATAALASGASDLALDRRHDPLARIEELRLHLLPAAERPDREQIRPRRELELAGDALHDGPVARLREDPLRRGGVEEVAERPCRRRGALRGREWVLDQDRRLRDHVLHRLVLLPGEDRLVLVGQENVALAGEERVQCLPRALVLDADVVEELRQLRPRALRRPCLLQIRAVGGHHVPARAAGGERVGRDHVDALLQEVVPRLDVLRVPVAQDEDDDRARDEAVVPVRVPVARDDAV